MMSQPKLPTYTINKYNILKSCTNKRLYECAAVSNES